MRNVFITGGAGGLGLAIASRHLEMGDRVWALDLCRSAGMERLLAAQDRLTFIPCDISSTPAVRAAVSPYLEAIGRLDLLYSCAGVYSFKDKVKLADTDLDRAAKMYDINAVGFLRVVQALLDVIRDGTHILCVTSEAGSISQNWRSIEYNYCMSKAAENMACVMLQRHFDDAGQASRVICLHPGWLRTAMGGEDAFRHPELSVSPEESAEGIVGIALDIDSIPRDCMYMDYQRKPYRW